MFLNFPSTVRSQRHGAKVCCIFSRSISLQLIVCGPRITTLDRTLLQNNQVILLVQACQALMLVLAWRFSMARRALSARRISDATYRSESCPIVTIVRLQQANYGRFVSTMHCTPCSVIALKRQPLCSRDRLMFQKNYQNAQLSEYCARWTLRIITDVI